MTKNDVYVFENHDHRQQDNVLTVDFHFSYDTDVDEAVAQIDAMVSQIDNDGDIEFTEHRPSIYCKSMRDVIGPDSYD
jgi:hypothetical protein